MGSLSLNTIYRLTGWAAGIGCLLLGATLIVTSFGEYERFHVGARELARFHSALIAATAVSVERGPANSAMGASADTMSALTAALANQRRITDASLDLLEQSFRDELAQSAEQREHARRLRARLAVGRKAVDAIAALPADRRGSDQVRDAIEAMFLVADTAAELRDDLGRTLARAYPQISTQIMLSTMCSNLRDYAGRLGSYVVMLLASHDGFDSDISSHLSNVEGRLADLRSLVSNYSGSVSMDAEVQRALADVDSQYIHKAIPFARETAWRAMGGTNDLSIDAFTKRYVPGMQPLTTLRDLISSDSQSRIENAKDDAKNALCFYIVLTAVVVGGLIVVRIASRQLLFLPLMHAKEQIVALGHGNLDDPPPHPKTGPEMQAMFEGLEALRSQQRRKRALEKSRERMALKLKRQSETDGLTGLLNRRAMEVIGRRAMGESIRDGRPLSVIIFDLDHFKSINDTYGHPTGDAVLKFVSKKVSSRLRPSDHFARFGGEEFLILLEDGDEERVRLVADRLRMTIAEASLPQRPDLAVRASFGVAARSDSDVSWESIIGRADQRLYLAKRSGRNCVRAGADEPDQAAGVAGRQAGGDIPSFNGSVPPERDTRTPTAA